MFQCSASTIEGIVLCIGNKNSMTLKPSQSTCTSCIPYNHSEGLHCGYNKLTDIELKVLYCSVGKVWQVPVAL